VDRQDQDLVIRRFGLTLALFDLGEAMMRQRFRRQHATATEPEIDVMITDWLQRRPGAKDGDCPGRVRPWPLP
jgi:hypothetical protein